MKGVWGWQWVFPASSHCSDPLTKEQRRHRLHESVMQKAMKEARQEVVDAGEKGELMLGLTITSGDY